MTRSRRGADLDEWRAIYEGRLAELTRVAAAIFGDRDAAQDVVQEAFVRAVRQRASACKAGVILLTKSVASLSQCAEMSPEQLVSEFRFLYFSSDAL
jgi:hypothetical protein